MWVAEIQWYRKGAKQPPEDKIKVLEDTKFPPDIRLEQLFTCVDDAAWIEAGRLYEDSFWFPAKTING